MTKRMKFQNSDFLVYLAIADAYALGCEFLQDQQYEDAVEEMLRFQGYISNPKYKSRPGFYTDDTEMSVANAKALIENSPPVAPVVYASKYLEEFQRGGKRKGYANGFYNFLCQIVSGQEFLEKIKPFSEKNGAAMRAVPFGAINDINAVLQEATTQAAITHNTSAGIFSSRVVALMSHYAFYSDDALFKNLPSYCLEYLPSEDVEKYSYVFKQRWPEQKVIGYSNNPIAITTIHTVIDLLTHQKSFMDILRQVIKWGGDTDSVAAIACGIFSINHPNQKIPAFMSEGLEGGSAKTGVAYLKEIGNRLIAKFS